MTLQNIQRYLTKYAEPEQKIATEFVEVYCYKQLAQLSLVIPCYRELENLDSLLGSISAAANASSVRVLVIIIVNNPLTRSKQAYEENKEFFSRLQSKLLQVKLIASGGRGFFGEYENLHILAIDRFSPGYELDPKQGVGHARKIGCDLALSFINLGLLSSQWVFTTDADVGLASDYFFIDQEAQLADVSVLLTPFKHRCKDSDSQEHRTAMVQYEQYLNHYVAGLKLAGSAYAFHNVGSTICFRAAAYAMVRGFPKKSAGEDFYFLNKMAKVGKVLNRNVQPMVLQGRVSTRVPFGTGRAIAAIISGSQGALKFEGYHPQTFIILKIFLQESHLFFKHRELQHLQQQLKLRLEEMDLDSEVGYKGSGQVWQDFSNLQDKLGLWEALGSAVRRSTHSSGASKHFEIWFDAFKTMKFIQYIKHFIISNGE